MRFLPWCFVAAVFALTLLPGLQMLSGLAPVSPVNENRALAPAVGVSTPLDQVPRVADRWFSDHFGLRSLLIRLKTQIDFSIFGMSDRVLVGRDGQLFYRSVVNVEEPLMEQTLGQNEAASLEGFGRIAHALRGAGIHFAVVVNMLSDRFYPELLPASAPRRAAEPRIDDFVAKLRALPDVTFIDSTAVLKTAMKDRRIFHKTDFHWNDPAAFAVGKALVDRMAQEEGRSASPWTYPLVVDTLHNSGGIAMFMPLFVPPSETALMVKQSWDLPPGYTQINEGFFEYVTTMPADPRLLPPTVFVGDSFLDGMIRSGLATNFVEMRRIRWKPDLKVSAIVASLPADTRWLVVQFIEVSQTAISDFAERDDIDKAVELLQKRVMVGASP